MLLLSVMVGVASSLGGVGRCIVDGVGGCCGVGGSASASLHLQEVLRARDMSTVPWSDFCSRIFKRYSVPFAGFSDRVVAAKVRAGI